MDWLRIASIACGALLLLWMGVGYLRTPKTPMSIPDVTPDDLGAVLSLATRLRSLGCKEGVSLCQQLLNVMLNHRAV